MKYNKIETTNNVISKNYPNCLKLFDEINLKDDDKLLEIDGLFGSKKVIDVDDVEKELATTEGKRNRNSTMDLAFLIHENISLRPFEISHLKNSSTAIYLKKDCKAQLVELRLNFKDLGNMKREKLIKKIEGSTLIFDKYRVPLNDHYIYVFKGNMIQQARNRMGRMVPEVFWKYEVTDLESLKRKYF